LILDGDDMLRRDYILRMIEEFLQVLSRLKALKQGLLWRQAAGTINETLMQLVGTPAIELARLSETELLARIIRGESPLAVRQKTLMIATLLKEAGDVAAAQGQSDDSRACHLRGLHLLLDALAQGDPSECPEFVPKVEVFRFALADRLLPLHTQALLMRHYERTGEFAKAEDALFNMLEVEPNDATILEFGISFYERLKNQSDANLCAGNLPRNELEASLAELRAR
jgi:hypothetical protein